MSSTAQIAANRLNSQKSTGPRSVEGKAVSKFNALKHGIDAASACIPGEDPIERQQLTEAFFQRFMPVEPDEIACVESMIENFWLCRRYTKIETALMTKMLAENGDLAGLFNPANPQSKVLESIMRHREAADRAFYRASKHIEKLIKLRAHMYRMYPDHKDTLPWAERTQSDAVPMPPSRPVEPENLALRL